MLRLVHNLASRTSMVWSLLGALTVVAVATGCSPSTISPVGSTNNSIQQVTETGRTLSNRSAFHHAVQLGLQAQRYQEKVTVNISEGSILSGFTVYGRVNPPNRASVAFHQNGFNFAYYQQGLSAYGEQDGHWQQTQAIADLNLFPSYAALFDAMQAENLPMFKLQPPQYVVDEYCDVYQMTIPARLLKTLPSLASTYQPGNSSAVLYTFYIGQKDGELRQVVTSSEGAVTGVGSVGIQTDTILFAINQSGSTITIDPNLYSTLLYQY